MVRINNILIDFNRDIWTYISNDLFKLKINKNEVGSSTMPQKLTPLILKILKAIFNLLTVC